MKKRIIFAGLIVAALGLSVLFRPQPAVHAENTRIVTIHMDGEVRTVASDGKTVKDVLAQTNAVLGSHDKTEPSLSDEVRGNDFTINVYRARPITVVDGANNYTVMTAERSPRGIAEDAGFETKQEDEFNFKRSDDPFAGAPGTQMVIKRAKTITFDLYGTSEPLSTNETTVGGLLKERGVTLENGDEINFPKAARIIEGMTISIATVRRAVETVEEGAPFPEEQIKDAQQPISYRKIQTPGTNGKKLVTYEIVIRNNGEPIRTAVKEVVTQEPIKQVVVVGTQTSVPYTGGGSKTEWLTAAGIPESDWGYADYIIGKESGWNPNAVNKSSGACGLAQAYPCSKVPGNPLNPVDSLRWVNGYVKRYGGWAGTYEHWLKHHSY